MPDANSKMLLSPTGMSPNPVAVTGANLLNYSPDVHKRMKISTYKVSTFATIVLLVFLIGCSNKKNTISEVKPSAEVKPAASPSAVKYSSDAPQTPFGRSGVSLETSSTGPKFRF